MRDVITVAHLTLVEARRRRIVLAGAVCALTFLVVFSVALVFATREMAADASVSFVERQGTLTAMMLVGFMAANFLSVMFAILLPIDTLSGEIDSGVMQTLASKPIDRAQIVLGKWAGHLVLALAYLLLVSAGILLAMRMCRRIRSGRRVARASAADARDHALADGRRGGRRTVQHRDECHRGSRLLWFGVHRRLCRTDWRVCRYRLDEDHRRRGESHQPGGFDVAPGGSSSAAGDSARHRHAGPGRFDADATDGVVGRRIYRAHAALRDTHVPSPGVVATTTSRG